MGPDESAASDVQFVLCRVDDTKDSIKNTYEDAKDNVKDSYRETRDSIKHRYNETNREINENIEHVKQSWRESMTPQNYVSAHVAYAACACC